MVVAEAKAVTVRVVVLVGAVDTVRTVVDVILRQLQAELIREGAGLYCARQVGAGAVDVVARSLRRWLSSRGRTLVTLGAMTVMGVP